MPETVETTDTEVIRTMTPVEYQKAHQAEEDHQRHVADLHYFVAFMTGELQGGTLSKLTPEGTDRLIENYLMRGAR